MDLSDCVEVGGINLPQTIRHDDGTVYRQTYQLNVDYDESVFIKPTPVETGPEAWRTKARD